MSSSDPKRFYVHIAAINKKLRPTSKGPTSDRQKTVRWMPEPAVIFAYDEAEDRILPHMLISVGLKEHSATGQTNHLLTATVRFLTEMPIIEIAAPVARRVPDPDLYDLPLLRFSAPGRETARTRTSR